MSVLAVAVIAAWWLLLALFGWSLSKAAAKPTPKLDPDRPILIALDDVTFEWPKDAA